MSFKHLSESASGSGLVNFTTRYSQFSQMNVIQVAVRGAQIDAVSIQDDAIVEVFFWS
jgi:hypothetical protein